MANIEASADQSRTTSQAPRAPFPYEQQSEEEFLRCRRSIPDSLWAKYTYFMRDERNGLIKIGMSKNPDERCKRLSSSGWHKMEILALARDGNLESLYHKHFADLCVGGEWFAPHPDLLAEIERLISNQNGPTRRWNAEPGLTTNAWRCAHD